MKIQKLTPLALTLALGFLVSSTALALTEQTEASKIANQNSNNTSLPKEESYPGMGSERSKIFKAVFDQFSNPEHRISKYDDDYLRAVQSALKAEAKVKSGQTIFTAQNIVTNYNAFNDKTRSAPLDALIKILGYYSKNVASSHEAGSKTFDSAMLNYLQHNYNYKGLPRNEALKKLAEWKQAGSLFGEYTVKQAVVESPDETDKTYKADAATQKTQSAYFDFINNYSIEKSKTATAPAAPAAASQATH